MSVQRQSFALLLLAVVNDECTATEALERLKEWSDLPWDEEPFAGAFHALMHYEADEDIRAEDSAYAKAQRAALRRWSDQGHSDSFGTRKSGARSISPISWAWIELQPGCHST